MLFPPNLLALLSNPATVDVARKIGALVAMLETGQVSSLSFAHNGLHASARVTCSVYILDLRDDVPVLISGDGGDVITAFRAMLVEAERVRLFQ